MGAKIICPVYQKQEEAMLFQGSVFCEKHPCPYGYNQGGWIDFEAEGKMYKCFRKGLLSKTRAREHAIDSRVE